MQYSQDNGTTWQTNNPTLAGLTNGSYTIEVRDANLCLLAYTNNPVAVTQPATAVTISAVSETDVTGCYGGNNGSITVTASGGTGALTFSDDGGATWNAGTSPYTFSSLVAGNYNIEVQDANGCTAIYSGNAVVVNQPTAVIISGVTSNNVSCSGGNNGSITVTASGGSGALTFSDDGGITWNAGTSPYTFSAWSRAITALRSRMPTVARPSTAATRSPSPSRRCLTASAAADTTICSGASYSLNGSASGGTGPYTYSWTPTTGLSDATAANPTAEVGSTTTYTVTVTDANGCTANASVVLTVPPLPNIESITMSGTAVTLVWDSLAGQTYRVQYTSDLTPTITWTDLTPDVTATGATATYTYDAAAATPRFYRIKIVCP